MGLDIAWGTAEIDVAHPLDDAVGTLADVPDCGPDVMAAFFGPIPELAMHPVQAVRWGPRFTLPAAVTARQIAAAMRGGAASH